MRQRIKLPLGAATVVAIALVGCQPANRETTVSITGASTVFPIVQMAAEKITELHGIRVEAGTGGSRRGYEDVKAGRSDLGAMARALADDETDVSVFPIAFDGVGILVHSSNPLASIDTESLRRIYRGQCKDWSQCGSPAGAIRVVGKGAGHGTYTVFKEHLGFEHDEFEVGVIAHDNAQVIRVVASDPMAIGYVSMGEVMASAEAGMPVRLVALDGVAATLEAVATGDYPLRRALSLISAGEPKPAARKLIEFFSTASGREVVRRARHVPLPSPTAEEHK